MRVAECIDRIRFATATQNELTGKSINTLFSNKNIVQQLMDALNIYASYTLAFEAIHTLPLDVNDKYIEQPPLALRSKTYRMIIIYIGGRAYPLSIPDLNTTTTQFPFDYNGIPRYVLPWDKLLYFFPINSIQTPIGTLKNDIGVLDTVIELSTPKAFLPKNGTITIGTEKILYGYYSEGIFYGCVRGSENTQKSIHQTNDNVTENNMHIFYYKKHFEIDVNPDDSIDDSILAKDMEVCDEHIRFITNHTAYSLLLKIDPNRATVYKFDFDKFLEEAKNYILWGRNKIQTSSDIRNPYIWETNANIGFMM